MFFSHEFYEKMLETHSDVKHLVKTFAEHKSDDEQAFKKVREDNEWQNKIIYGGLGIIAFLTFASHFIK